MRGLPPLGRWIGLAMICAGLGTVSLARPEVAEAAAQRASDRPTAVAISTNGTAYVGFAGGSRIQRLAAGNGRPKGTLELPDDSAVAGLFATSGGSVWVDQESGVSLLGAGGHVLSRFEHRPERSCGNDAPPSRYGGITAHGNTVYVANRCHGSVSVYSREGHLRATVDLPGGGYPRGISYGVAQAGKPATLYVAMPDRGVVLAYRAGTLRSSSKPMRTYTVKRPSGGKKPAPGGVAVDKWGQLTIGDMANNAVYMVDANNRFTLYRTLGHPPRASRQAGRLDMPGALAQHPQDGSGMAGDLFIADTNNARVQRWNNSGYTYWAKKVNAGPGGNGPDGPDDPDDPDNPGDPDEGPANTTRPSVTGDARVGGLLSCDAGTWDAAGGGSISYAFQWLRTNVPLGTATGDEYTAVAADAGRDITCQVRATTGRGSATAVSLPVRISTDGSTTTPPVNDVRPTVTGTATVGSPLTCNPGQWTPAAPTFTYQWKRETVPLGAATAATYTLVPADAGKAITCTVTATTAGGKAEATSLAVTPTTGTGPTNTELPRISGAASVGQVVTCLPGTWSVGGLTFGYQWKRGGVLLDAATSAGYTVVSADQGTSLTCTVTATAPDGGTGQATSLPVVPTAAGVPANTEPPRITGTPAVGEQLTCTPGTWTANPTFAYQWKRAGVPIAPATGQLYTVGAADQGLALTCTVTAQAPGGLTAEATSAAVTPTAAVLPVNTSPPRITPSGTVLVGQALTCDRGQWTGSPTFGYTWRRGGTPIDGATSASYTPVGADGGTQLVCTVTATNTAGPAAASSNAVTVVDAAPPVNTSPPALVGSGAVGTGLTCDEGDWTGTGNTFRYRWNRNGTPIADAASDRYLVLSEDVGASISCTVTATNTAGPRTVTSAARSLDGVVVGAPTPTAAPVITGTAAVGQTLTCDQGSWTNAPTGFTTLWQRDGVTVDPAGASHLVIAADEGATLRCLVIATNALGKGAARSLPIGGSACQGPVGVTINGGAAVATSPNVQLSIRVPAGTTSITISNKSDLSGALTVTPTGTCSYPWTMDSIAGIPLTWSVYVRFDSDPTTYTDAITIDQPAMRLRLW